MVLWFLVVLDIDRLLPLTEAAQRVISVMRDLELLLKSRRHKTVTSRSIDTKSTVASLDVF